MTDSIDSDSDSDADSQLHVSDFVNSESQTQTHSETESDMRTDDQTQSRAQTDGGENNTTATGMPDLSSESFASHWFEQTAIRNKEENHPERNDPAHSWPIGRVEPHQLGNCQRKWFYQWLNAPKESPDPHGIFAMGHYIEEEVIEPWIRDVFEPTYEIQNAIHVSVDIDSVSASKYTETEPESTDEGTSVAIPHSIEFNQPADATAEANTDSDSISVTVAGSTDPAICDPESGEVVALTEVKSTGSLGRITEPKRRHLLQIHAYLKSLDIENGYLIYVDRDELLGPKIFEVTFDEAVWERVTDWVMDTLPYALNGDLPPADPPESWMCNYCEYQNRCGKGRSNLGGNMGVTGFVPGLSKYPKHMVVDHLEAYPEVGLTPTLASTYPELADEHSVVPWACPRCNQEFDHTDDHFQSFKQQTGFETPYCPVCEEVFDKQVYLEL